LTISFLGRKSASVHPSVPATFPAKSVVPAFFFFDGAVQYHAILCCFVLLSKW
jgi:hypothetical protein